MWNSTHYSKEDTRMERKKRGGVDEKLSESPQ